MQNNPSEATDTPSEPPTGAHALEVAARLGFGPLSPQAQEAWHGHGTPCVTCGQIVRRDATACGHCGQNLRPAMLEKMKAHAGPWYVLEHLRPFPGINLETIVKQIHRGVLTETSIVRGPATNHQWRFALETPGLCRYFGKCWHCFSQIGQAEMSCQQCGEHLTFEPQRPSAMNHAARGPVTCGTHAPNGSAPGAPGAGAASTEAPSAAAAPFTAARARFNEDAANQTGAAGATTSELDQLRAALSQGVINAPDSRVDAPATIAGIRAGWFAAGVVVIVLASLWMISNSRSSNTPPQAGVNITAPANTAPKPNTPNP